jgi:hypothetical protein
VQRGSRPPGRSSGRGGTWRRRDADEDLSAIGGEGEELPKYERGHDGVELPTYGQSLDGPDRSSTGGGDEGLGDLGLSRPTTAVVR